jgi:hypothetical protein
MLLVKYDSDGQQTWVQQLDRMVWLGPRSLVVGSDGSVYLTGIYSPDSDHNGALIAKYRSDGFLEWQAIYEEPGSHDTGSRFIGIDPSGNVIIAAVAQIGTTVYPLAVQYGPSGDQRWVARHVDAVGTWNDVSRAALDAQGNIYLAGSASRVSHVEDPSQARRNYLTIKFTAGGEEAWARQYDGPDGLDDYASSIVVDSENHIYVAGTSAYKVQGNSESPGVPYGWATVRYNEEGEVVWIRRFDGLDHSLEVHDITCDLDGNIYLTGSRFGGKCVTLKYSADGDLRWIGEYATRYPDLWTYSTAGLALDALGHVYVAATTVVRQEPKETFDFTLIQYPTAGYDSALADGSSSTQLPAVPVCGSSGLISLGIMVAGLFYLQRR